MPTSTLVKSTLTVQAATSSDADRIHAMTQAAYAEYAGTDAPSSVARERADDLRAALACGETQALLVLDGAEPVGSVRYRLEPQGLYFFRLGVLPRARGRGVARALVTRLEEIARQHEAPRLWCRVRMNVARNVGLYESAGFRLIDQERVRRGVTDVPTGTMEKRLP